MSHEFTTAVDELQRATGVDRGRAEATIRAQASNLGIALPPVPDAARDARILEDQEQHEITKLFLAHGFKVYSTSQKRAAKVTPGIPDLWVTRSARPGRGAIAFWWESKRQVGGKRTSGQVDFGDECAAAGVGYGFGDRYDARQFLRSLGIGVE